MEKLKQSLPVAVCRFAVPLVLVAGLMLTAMGMLRYTGPSFIAWGSAKSLAGVMISLALIWGCFMLMQSRLKLHSFSAFAVAVVFLSVLSGNLLALLAGGLFVLSSAVLGERILNVLGIGESNTHDIDSFLTGAGAYGLIVGLAAHFPINSPATCGLLIIAPLLSRRSAALQKVKTAYGFFLSENAAGKKDPFGALVATLAIVHFIAALLPELGFDALALHLLVPSHLLYRGEWGFNPSFYSLALIPMLGDWIFSIGYLLSGETGARMFSLIFTYAMACQGFRLALWLGGNRKAAGLAVLFFLSMPLTFTETSSLYVEAIWGTFVTAGVMAAMRLMINDEKNTEGDLKAVGLFLAIAANAKAVTLPVTAALAVFLFLSMRRWFGKGTVKPFAVSFALFVVIGSIPYVTAWLIAGNPVFPFFNAVFRSPYYPPVNFNNSFFNSGVTWDLLYRMLFNPEKYLEASIGASGFQFLLLLPAALLFISLRKNWRSWLLFAIALLSLVLVFRSQSYLRYIFPLFLMVSTIIAAAIFPENNSHSTGGRLLTTATVIAVTLNVAFLPSATWVYRNFPLHVLVNEKYRDAFLLRREPTRLAVEMLNRINLERSPVAFFTANAFGAGLNADALYPNWYNHRFREGVKDVKSAQDLSDLLSSYGSSYLIFDETWGDPNLRKFIETASEELARYRQVTVRRLRNEYRFKKGPAMHSDLPSAGSTMASPAISLSQEITVVTPHAPVSRLVLTNGRRLYRNAIAIECDHFHTKGRVRIKWLGSNGNRFGGSTKIFSLQKNRETYQRLTVASKGSNFVELHGTSRGNGAIQLSKTSRQ